MQDEKLTGTVDKVFFSNKETGFSTGVLSVTNNGPVRFAGSCFVREGDRVELHGGWHEDPKYGLQFKVKIARQIVDESASGLAGILADGSEFKGIGNVRGKALVDAAEALDVGSGLIQTMIDRPDAVAARAGVKVELVTQVAEALRLKRDEYAILASITEIGWTTSQAQSIVGCFGGNASSMARDNPYDMIGVVPRFGFKTVDAVALKMGVGYSDPARVSAGILYCLGKVGDEGHTYTERSSLLNFAEGELRPDTLREELAIRERLSELIKKGDVVAMVSPMGKKIVGLASLAQIESRLFQRLLSWIDDENLEPINLEKGGDHLERLNQGQRRAVAGVFRRRLSIISGGAGVGKTFTMRSVIEVAEANSMTVALCAPTGKAAQQLARATGRQAQTIHMTLSPYFNDETSRMEFRRNEFSPLQEDLIIVDEASMIDVKLMSSLVAAAAGGARVLMVGDHNQIPSVGPGAVLRDLLGLQAASGIDSIHILNEVVRQAGILARNTSAILGGIVPPEEPPYWMAVRAERATKGDHAREVANLVEFFVTETPEGRDTPFGWMDVQVLAPMKKGDLGVRKMNQEIQKVRQRLLGNPPPEEVADDRPLKIYPGDRVIWTKNEYKFNLLNGTLATVEAIHKGGAMSIKTERGEIVEVPSEMKNRVDLAYAITIHKSQGSEWPCVILCASTAHHVMHDRNLLYTGASRASERLVIFGDQSGIKRFAREKRSTRRKTLGSLMIGGWTPAILTTP